LDFEVTKKIAIVQAKASGLKLHEYISAILRTPLLHQQENIQLACEQRKAPIVMTTSLQSCEGEQEYKKFDM
jgi:hypothetical protein